MELLQLKYFKTVAECGRINKAAEELYVSSPALSASISRLEKDLGVKLFERGNNRIVLNEQGKIFLSYVNQIFSNIECAKMDMRHSLEERAVNIQLAVTCSNLWMELFDAYSQARPDVTLSANTLRLSLLQDIDMMNRYVFLMADRDDMGQNNLESALLFVDRPYVMVPKDHPLAQKEDVSLLDLVNEVMFLPLAGQSLNKRIRRMFSDANLPVKYASEYTTEACQYVVSKGRGISFTTQYAPHPDPNICYMQLRQRVHWEQRLYWNPYRKFSREETEFRDFVLSFFQSGAEQVMSHVEYYMLDG